MALHSYVAHGPDELELQKGEGVRVFGKDHDGWLRGMSLVTGRVGIFPSNYVAPLFRSGFSYIKQNMERAVGNTQDLDLLVPTEKPLWGSCRTTRAGGSSPGGVTPFISPHPDTSAPTARESHLPPSRVPRQGDVGAEAAGSAPLGGGTRSRGAKGAAPASPARLKLGG